MSIPLHLPAWTLCLLAVIGAGEAFTAEPPLAAAPAEAKPSLEGLWAGSWGGGPRNGVVFQPVIAEMVIQGPTIELAGFPQVGDVVGGVRVEPAAKKLRILPVGDDAKEITYAYELKGDEITLTGGGGVPVTLKRVSVPQPLANVQVELALATSLTADGNLTVTETTVLKTGRDATHLAADKIARRIAGGKIFVVREASVQEIPLAEARRLLAAPTPIVLAYRPAENPPAPQLHKLWKPSGRPQPDSEAIRRTFGQLLRPGSLIFVLPAAASVPEP